MNKQVRLARYPVDIPTEEDFTIVESPIPEPGPGEFLVRAIFLSLDPWHRLRMRDPALFGRQYGKSIEIGNLIPGAMVGEVVRSQNPGFRPGDLIESKLGWQQYAIYDGSGDRSDDAKGFSRINPALRPLSLALGALGRTGMTAYFSLLDMGRPQPGSTVLVTSAAGATGSIAGQIAKIAGCRVVGVVGSDAKSAAIKDELGFDAAVNYRAHDLDAALTEACPNGIDVFLDMVGGPIAEAVLKHMNDFARCVIIGNIAEYDRPIDRYVGLKPQGYILAKRLRMEGFVVHDYAWRYVQALPILRRWLDEGRIKAPEQVSNGIANVPKAFIAMLKGENYGKAVVRVGPDPADR